MRSVILTLSVLAFYPLSAQATFIDLRGVVFSDPITHRVLQDGISLSFSVPTFGISPTRFGIDSAGDNDVPDLFDGGNGVAESTGFSFGPLNAVLDSIVISNFDGDDAGIVNFKGVGEFPLHNGVNVFSLPFSGATSLHFIAWRGPNSPGETRGFSLDGFNFHLVPEPSSLLLATCALAFCLSGLRRRPRRTTD
jgi:hypothetical protein